MTRKRRSNLSPDDRRIIRQLSKEGAKLQYELELARIEYTELSDVVPRKDRDYARLRELDVIIMDLARKASGLTRTAIAKKFGVPVNTISATCNRTHPVRRIVEGKEE